MKMPELKSMWARMIRRIEPCFPTFLILTFLLVSGPYSLQATGTSDKPEAPKHLVATTEKQYVVLNFARECLTLNENAHVEVAVKDNGDPDLNQVRVFGLAVKTSCGELQVRKKTIADGGPIPMCDPSIPQPDYKNGKCRYKIPNKG